MSFDIIENDFFDGMKTAGIWFKPRISFPVSLCFKLDESIEMLMYIRIG